ncbi:complex I subunit 4 family protein [Adhaeribacter pallidiroseus]|uniref:NADH:ubiquinone reductase (H(+)-translocating) n=1 Tax=Adhaeribacter pallidiroseus TaxID=2072847 RepID=A0A369QJE2_9BACT|nr:NADH-quinone oxidoreductase subunit M [Adhaeribacter pallidiroseus]RDC63346.1 NADH:ubiquinone reductase (H(+)-translocating) [Adhaeribacter pallidiroseus]
MNFILTSLIFVPLVSVLLILALPSRSVQLIRTVVCGITFLELLLAVWVYLQFQTVSPISESGYQFVEKVNWITLSLNSLGFLQITYFLGVDGLSISMVLLTGIIGFMGAISSLPVTKSIKGYFALYLLLLGSIMGCFLALDLFLFYLFFEFMLLPMYFLIGIWGGSRREYAAIKFFIYTLVGSIFILIVIIGLYTSVIDPQATAWQANLLAPGTKASPAVITHIQQLLAAGKLPSRVLVHTFSIPDMITAKNFIPDSLLHVASGKMLGAIPIRLMAFLLIFAGFAIKMPLVPVHTWLPDAHVEAPTPISVILASLLLKVGAYGLLRIVYPVFPDAAVYYSFFLGLLGVITIIYGALCALAMSDLKKLIAYSSVSHMGFVLLGLAALTSEGVNGAIYQMFSHGLISAMLFLVVGVIYDRSGSRSIVCFRGLAEVMPAFTTVTVIAFFASLGLPGLAGFIAEFLVLLGAFASATTSGMLPPWLAVAAMAGMILGAAYYLWTLQRMFFGKHWIHPELRERTKLPDLTTREYCLFIPLAILVIVFGIFPSILLDKIGPGVSGFLEHVLVQGGMPITQALPLLP